ncbi:2-phospho-L-lactate transferase [Pollutimonas sp. H1-120]|uniref:2-phospho-L-lactate transferase n=1 Tax=Pollutimonas sp. H1-120 TaxID=3148824 RepID=UPI003B52D39D
MIPAESLFRPAGRVVALCGGVGGAKLARGLADLLGGRLQIIVNTGDDFEHLGLSISPDIDSVLYALAGLNDKEKGWGRAGESWSFMQELERFGEETWFQLGDRDLAVHVARTRALQSGQTLSEVTSGFAERLGIEASVIPMSDDKVRTIVHVDTSELPFQHYFVKHQCQPKVCELEFRGAAEARVSPQALSALHASDLAAIMVCPSNPYLSIGPMLAIPGIRHALEKTSVPILAVSPLVGGRAVKGPLSKLMEELSVRQGNEGIVQYYGDLLDGLIIDETDSCMRDQLGLPVMVAQTLMSNEVDRRTLAAAAIDFAKYLGSEA